MPPPGFWSRVRQARLFRVLVVYLAASWLILQVTSLLREEFQLPQWVTPLTVLFLLVGVVIISATAWVQSHPLASARAKREEIPGSWEIDLGDVRESVTRGRLPHLTWGRTIVGGVIAFSLLFGLAGLYVLVKDRGRAFTPGAAIASSAAPGIAVLPFSVRGAGLETWREGMVDLLSTNLDGVSGLRTIDSRTVLAKWREGVQGAAIPELDTALEIARRTGARYALVGSAVAIGSDVRLAADVYEVQGGRNLGQGQVEGSPDSVLGLVDRLSIEVLRAILKGEPGELPRVNLARVTTASLPALKSYLEGEVFYRRADFAKAIAAYRSAVEADSTFALALYRLFLAHGWAEQLQSDLAAQYIARAARFADRLPEREALLVRAGHAMERGTLEGLEALQQAVRKYPDDPEAWYLLGDTYWHLGDQALVPLEELGKPLTRAIELDPSFAPAYIHLIELSFSLYADSGRVARLVETYGRLAPGGRFDSANRFAFLLAYGDAAGRHRALAAVDTLQVETLRLLPSHLRHPRFLGLTEELLRRALRRPDVPLEKIGGWLFLNHYQSGKVRAVLEDLTDPRVPPGLRALALYSLVQQGVSVPSELLERELAVPSGAGDPDERLFAAALYAADRGRWADFDAALEQGRGYVAVLLAAGDSSGARLAEEARRALEAYSLWRKGKTEEAARLLVEVQRRATGYGFATELNREVRWWLGEIMLELGRPQEAERYFSSFWYGPWAAYRLGKIYEDLGQYEEARKAYELVLLAWREADPELQPRVEEARAGARRLTSVIGE